MPILLQKIPGLAVDQVAVAVLLRRALVAEGVQETLAETLEDQDRTLATVAAVVVVAVVPVDYTTAYSGP
jgi:flagellar biosynthesis component FlhA